MPVIWEKAVTDGGSLFWSKASWIRKLAPSVKIDEKLELEQSKLIWEVCSKCGEKEENRLGARKKKEEICSKPEEIIEKR